MLAMFACILSSRRTQVSKRLIIPSTVYISKEGWQPVCKGLDEHGNLIWDLQMKEPWHLKMFPVRYKGDFSEQWMWLCLQQSGMEWVLDRTVEEDYFAQRSRKLLDRVKRRHHA
jgi:hypothetical protein